VGISKSNCAFVMVSPFLELLRSEFLYLVPQGGGGVKTLFHDPKLLGSLLVYRSFLNFLEKGVVHKQNLDTWEFGKGALRTS
jgi:hypothetical protein